MTTQEEIRMLINEPAARRDWIGVPSGAGLRVLRRAAEIALLIGFCWFLFLAPGEAIAGSAPTALLLVAGAAACLRMRDRLRDGRLRRRG